MRTKLPTLLGTVLVAAALAVEVARLSVASQGERPDRSLAPQIPPSLASSAMTDVGRAAARGDKPGAETKFRLHALAVSAPLATEPFLVEAALSERAGNYDRAAKLLAQAKLREPRSLAATYLYADVLLRQEKALEALRQIAILTRLVPAASVGLIPSLSAFAHAPGGREKLLSVLPDNPQLKQPLLQALSADPDNADLVLTIAGKDLDASKNGTREWEARLLAGLIARGDYDRAYGIWRRFAGLPAGAQPLVFNGTFNRLSAPPPFNWDYPGSNAGVAEPENGSLHVVYYGRDNTVLATQLTLLSPGRYTFASQGGGQAVAQSLRWTVRCVGGGQLITAPVGASARNASFSVPASGCAAQRLELSGTPNEDAQQSDVTIGAVAIEQVGK